MKTRLLGSCAVAMLLGCSYSHPATDVSAPAGSPAAQGIPPAAASGAATPPVRLAARQLYEVFAAVADTTLRWQGQPYRLSWRVRLDTLQPLTHITPPDPARGFRGDTSRGFQGYYALEVRDSLGHRVGRRTFTKADFYPAVGPELAISSYAELPRLLGYSAPLGGLVFTVPFNAPGTDWCGEAVLVLAPTGQMRYLGVGPSDGGPALTTTLSGDGRTLLTASAIQRAGQPALPLARAGAELCGAQLLNDTLALLLYQPGQLRYQSNGLPYLAATAAQRRQSNTFVLDMRSGRTLSRFRYDGFYEELGYVVPSAKVAQAVYLLDAEKGLYLLPLRQPTTGRLISFAAMTRAAGPAAAGEVSFELTSPAHSYRFLADTTNAAHVRYQLLAD